MPLLNEIKDKKSKKTSGSVQAFTDTGTRDNTEKDYYDNKWLKERFSTEEINLLKKEFGITSDSALRTKVESMSDYDLDVLLNRLKNPGTTAYPGYEEPAKEPSTNHMPSPSSKPTISKEQEFENTFRYNKNLKGITDAEFDLLKESVGGKETEAKKMVINLPAHILRDVIHRQIKENQEELLALTNNTYAHDKLRDDYSEQEIELLKRHFNIYDENKLILKTDSMSDYDMDVLLYKLKQPYRFGEDNTSAYSGYGLNSIVPVSQVQPALPNSNSANNLSNDEIAMLKEHFRTDSEAQALAMAETKSDYELDRILDYQKIFKQREGILDNAYEFLNFTWIPKKNLDSWDDDYTYEAGIIQHGVPYSQSRRLSLEDFIEVLDNKNFYSNDYSQYVGSRKENVEMPLYGTDCSAFVSDVWGLPKMATWTIHNQIEGKVEKPKFDYLNYISSIPSMI